MNYPDDINLLSLLPHSWLHVLNKTIVTQTESKLLSVTREARCSNLDIYPYNYDDIFKIFNKCSFENVKVVILAQDPYYAEKSQATGIAFDVPEEVKKPPSLKNIIKELKNNCNLLSWVTQGVFLLNTSLTVTEKKPNSHIDVWKEFTDNVISSLQSRDNIIFCLWGNNAQKKKDLITSRTAIILESSHPSPLSAYKTSKPFLGSNVFGSINEILVKNKKTPIQWF